MKLYAYWRSSASWRARIILNLKGFEYEVVPVHLVRDGGEHRKEPHTKRNALQQVPVLEFADGTLLSQSLAIAIWADKTVSESPLVPEEPLLAARAWQLAEIVNAGIQPLQNLSVLQHLDRLGGDKMQWAVSVMERGFVAMEAIAKDLPGDFLVGDTPTIADITLVPQLYNARRFGVPLHPYPSLLAAEAQCVMLEAFQKAHPDRQIDAQL